MDQVTISNFRPHEKGTLRGFFTITIPSGLVINECMLHELNGRQWIGFAARSYVKDGVQRYATILEFVDREASDGFTTAALRAIDEAGLGCGNDNGELR